LPKQSVFSRSAPAACDNNHTQSVSLAALTRGTGSYPQVAGGSQPPSTPIVIIACHGASPSTPFAGSHFTTIDLRLLFTSPSPHPTVISAFMASKPQHVVNVNPTSDGISQIVSAEDGRVTRAFQFGLFRLCRGSDSVTRISGLTCSMPSKFELSCLIRLAGLL